MAMKSGQHFLINKKKIKKFVDALDLNSGETIIEIGPGHGEITRELVNWGIGELDNEKLILIEKDKFLAESLREKYSQNKKIEVVEGDALRILPGLINKLTNKPINYKLVGNIPFYITGYLFRVLGEIKNKPSLIVFFLQKEVAERICAVPPRMNLLAASVQIWAEPKIIDYLSKKDFWPMPKVDSAIIKLETKDKRQETRNAEGYYKLIRILFKQPRKTILNNLASSINHKVSGIKKEEIIKKLTKLGINSNNRPQDLSVKQIKELSTLF